MAALLRIKEQDYLLIMRNFHTRPFFFSFSVAGMILLLLHIPFLFFPPLSVELLFFKLNVLVVLTTVQVLFYTFSVPPNASVFVHSTGH